MDSIFDQRPERATNFVHLFHCEISELEWVRKTWVYTGSKDCVDECRRSMLAVHDIGTFLGFCVVFGQDLVVLVIGVEVCAQASLWLIVINYVDGLLCAVGCRCKDDILFWWE